MADTGFTPGPWSAVIPIDLDCNLPFVLTSDGGSPLEPETLANPGECEANAHLIAAAPTLYEALQCAKGLLDTPICRHRFEGNDLYAETVAEINATLKQARGEA